MTLACLQERHHRVLVTPVRYDRDVVLAGNGDKTRIRNGFRDPADGAGEHVMLANDQQHGRRDPRKVAPVKVVIRSVLCLTLCTRY